MFYSMETNKSFEEVSKYLEIAVAYNKFGVLHVHNLGDTLRNKGIDFKEESKVFEVCNPNYANKILEQDMLLNTVLPCRISIYTEKNTTKIAILKPSKMFESMTTNHTILKLALEIDEIMIKLIEESKNREA